MSCGGFVPRHPGYRRGMWLFFFVLPLAIVLIVGGLLAGGIYTIVFLPVAVIVAIGGIIYTMWGRSAQARDIPGEAERVQPLPHTNHSNTPASPTTPDQLVDAQRHQQ